MNNREIKWEIKKVAPGMVKIETNPLGRMPTFDEFKQKAKELLSNERITDLNNKLRDETRSQDLGDSMLLSREFENHKKEIPVYQVVFTYKNATLTANSKTIDEIVEKEEITGTCVNEFGTNPDITEQVLEGLER